MLGRRVNRCNISTQDRKECENVVKGGQKRIDWERIDFPEAVETYRRVVICALL